MKTCHMCKRQYETHQVHCPHCEELQRNLARAEQRRRDDDSGLLGAAIGAAAEALIDNCFSSGGSDSSSSGSDWSGGGGDFSGGGASGDF